jgi:type I restriction enzyme S subunit
MEYKTIKELCDLVVDCPHSTPTWTEHGKIVIRNNNIKNGRIDFTSPSFTDDEHFAQRIKRAVPKAGDIVITREAPMGEVGMIPEGIECCLGQRMVLLRANERICDKHYLLYGLQSQFVQHQISWSEGTGTTVSNLRIPHLEQIRVPYVPLDQQKKISSVLYALEDKIENNRKLNDNLELQAQLIYSERFEGVKSNDLPSGWRVVPLGEIAMISNKNFNPLKESERILEHYSIPAFDETKFPIFEPSTSIKSNKFVVDSSCFLISKLNPTVKRVWKPYCLTGSAVCSTEFIVYKSKKSYITDFLYSVIDSNSFSDFMCSHVTGSTGSRQRTIPSDTLSYKVILPSEDELIRFQSLVSPIYSRIRNNAIENDRLKQLRNSLLPKLMSGEIDVSNIKI